MHHCRILGNGYFIQAAMVYNIYDSLAHDCNEYFVLTLRENLFENLSVKVTCETAS